MSEQATQLGPDGKPDPTALVQAAIDRLERKIMENVVEKFDGLEALMLEKFAGVRERQDDDKEACEIQMKSLDARLVQAEKLRLELKADNEKNIDKALTGVKDANDKLETAITRTLTQMSETAKSDNEGLRRDIDGLKDRFADSKERVVGIEQQKIGAVEQRKGFDANIGLVIAIAGFAILVIGFLATKGP